MTAGIRTAVLIVLVVCCSLAAQVAMAQDVDEGERIARQWCSGCHQVDRKPVRANDAIPSFAAIAQMPSTTQMSLAAFLDSPHGRMPDYSLTRSEIRDVSAYILDLRRKADTDR